MNISINPLQWLATEDGWLDFANNPPLGDMLEQLSAAGFRSVHAEVPSGVSVTEYGQVLDAYGFVPAPGYFSGALEDPQARGLLIDEAGRLAAQHQQLGLTELLVGAGMHPTATRVLTPAQGAEPSAERLARIAETLEAVGAATLNYGVASCLHPHVGTWVESEAEIEWLLTRIPSDLIALGPDTGHLAWAGVDPLEFIRRHRDRVRALHVKDIRLAIANQFRDKGTSYREVVTAGLWVEPGRGDLDFRLMFEALDGSACQWAIVEVDRPDLPIDASLRACGEWAALAASW